MGQDRATKERASFWPSAEQVADLIEVVRKANARVPSEVNSTRRSRAALGHSTVCRLERLAHDLRTAAAARRSLAELEPDLLMEGASLWMRRRSCSVLAEQRWSGWKSA